MLSRTDKFTGEVGEYCTTYNALVRLTSQAKANEIREYKDFYRTLNYNISNSANNHLDKYGENLRHPNRKVPAFYGMKDKIAEELERKNGDKIFAYKTKWLFSYLNSLFKENNFRITKLKEGHIDVPIIKKENIIKRGAYIMRKNGDAIKVGIYGEGVKSTNKTRFADYRHRGKNIKPGNGSYLTMKKLNSILKIGESVEVEFITFPNDRFIDGYQWKVDLYHEEEKLKNKHKDTLLLS